MSFFGQLYKRVITWLLGVPYCFFWKKTLTAWTCTWKIWAIWKFEHCWMLLKLTRHGRERKDIDKLLTLHVKTRSFFEVSFSLVRETMIKWNLIEPLWYVFQIVLALSCHVNENVVWKFFGILLSTDILQGS